VMYSRTRCPARVPRAGPVYVTARRRPWFKCSCRRRRSLSTGTRKPINRDKRELLPVSETRWPCGPCKKQGMPGLRLLPSCCHLGSPWPAEENKFRAHGLRGPPRGVNALLPAAPLFARGSIVGRLKRASPGAGAIARSRFHARTTIAIC